MNKIKIRGNAIYYEDLNRQNENVILMVHGHPFDHSMWKYQYNALENFRLIVPDLKGYGKSDYKFDKIFIEEQALDLALLMDRLEIDNVNLMGLSMGGQIIVEFCRLFPSRVDSLIICASTPSAETENGYISRLRLADAISQSGMLNYTTKDIHKYLNIDNSNSDSEVYKHLYKMMSETKTEGAVASHRGRAERRDNFDSLKKVNIPTLVIAGEKDYFFKVKDLKRVAAQIPKSKFIVLENSGHLPNMEFPEIFNTTILEFYNRIYE